MLERYPEDFGLYDREDFADVVFDDPDFSDLADALADPNISRLTQADQPLTRERLDEVLSDGDEIIETAEANGLKWPDDATAVVSGDPTDPYYDDEQTFGERTIINTAVYNNFPIILASEPDLPRNGEDMMAFMRRARFYAYASKPYLHRAHLVAPEFMGALQRVVQASYGMDDWRKSLSRAVSEELPDPKDTLLLHASKAAYELCINVMRTDDLQIQYELLGLTTTDVIEDPALELRT